MNLNLNLIRNYEIDNNLNQTNGNDGSSSQICPGNEAEDFDPLCSSFSIIIGNDKDEDNFHQTPLSQHGKKWEILKTFTLTVSILFLLSFVGFCFLLIRVKIVNLAAIPNIHLINTIPKLSETNISSYANYQTLFQQNPKVDTSETTILFLAKTDWPEIPYFATASRISIQGDFPLKTVKSILTKVSHFSELLFHNNSNRLCSDAEVDKFVSDLTPLIVNGDKLVFEELTYPCQNIYQFFRSGVRFKNLQSLIFRNSIINEHDISSIQDIIFQQKSTLKDIKILGTYFDLSLFKFSSPTVTSVEIMVLKIPQYLNVTEVFDTKFHTHFPSLKRLVLEIFIPTHVANFSVKFLGNGFGNLESADITLRFEKCFHDFGVHDSEMTNNLVGLATLLPVTRQKLKLQSKCKFNTGFE